MLSRRCHRLAVVESSVEERREGLVGPLADTLSLLYCCVRVARLLWDCFDFRGVTFNVPHGDFDPNKQVSLHLEGLQCLPCAKYRDYSPIAAPRLAEAGVMGLLLHARLFEPPHEKHPYFSTDRYQCGITPSM